MTEFDYERWWALHLRVVKGETLSQTEEEEYAYGQALLDGQDENLDMDMLSRLRALRGAIERAEQQHARLFARSKELDKEIARMETIYREATGHELGANPYARV